MIRAGAILAAAALAGCIPMHEPVYAVRRSALVPHPAAPERSGFPLGGPVRISLHDSTVLVPIAPVESDGANAGLYVARHNVGGALRVRTGPCDLGPIWEVALLQCAMPLAGDTIRPPRGPATIWGVTTACSAPITAAFRVGIAAELRAATIPYFEEGRCIFNCTDASKYYTESGAHTVGIGGFSILPSYRRGPATWWAGITYRDHPTNVERTTQTPWNNWFDNQGEVDSGPVYRILSAGVEARIRPGLSLLAQLSWPMSTSVASYGPTLGLAIALEPGKRPAPRTETPWGN